MRFLFSRYKEIIDLQIFLQYTFKKKFILKRVHYQEFEYIQIFLWQHDNMTAFSGQNIADYYCIMSVFGVTPGP